MFRFIAVILALLIPATAHAADGAQSRAIGFSPDARYFAFEQYGHQDGSGFAYSDIYVLDIKSDSWVKGTPVRMLSGEDEENPKISDVRAKALQQVRLILDELKIDSAYDTLAHRPFTEIISDRRKVRFARYYNSMGNVEGYDAMGSYELSVQDVKVAQPPECPDGDFITFVGMELTLKNVKTGVSKPIIKDASIPKSRYCPHGYDIEAIFAPADYGLPDDPMVALIGVYSRGFEGSDRRFIAVPFSLFE
ncbi:MAG: DUF2259 domain-containing protein [Proteobacteria bacterium]|nr:DUF2259 domain-containing protein [Pseudomonadota bacterium]